MIAIWPATLPQRMREDAYNEGSHDARVRTSMDQGPPKVRRSASPGKPVTGALRVTPSGKARLERFFTEDTASGTLPFWLPAQSLDGALLATVSGAPLLTATGAPLLVRRWWLVTFGQQAPQYTPDGIRWRAALDLTVLL